MTEVPQEHARPFSCSQCNTRYTRAEHLTRHIISRHQTPRASTPTDSGVPSDGSPATVDLAAQLKVPVDTGVQGIQNDGRWRGHVCEVCGKGFGRKDILRRHEKGHIRTAAGSSAGGVAQSSSLGKRARKSIKSEAAEDGEHDEPVASTSQIDFSTVDSFAATTTADPVASTSGPHNPPVLPYPASFVGDAAPATHPEPWRAVPDTQQLPSLGPVPQPQEAPSRWATFPPPTYPDHRDGGRPNKVPRLDAFPDLPGHLPRVNPFSTPGTALPNLAEPPPRPGDPWSSTNHFAAALAASQVPFPSTAPDSDFFHWAASVFPPPIDHYAASLVGGPVPPPVSVPAPSASPASTTTSPRLSEPLSAVPPLPPLPHLPQPQPSANNWLPLPDFDSAAARALNTQMATWAMPTPALDPTVAGPQGFGLHSVGPTETTAVAQSLLALAGAHQDPSDLDPVPTSSVARAPSIPLPPSTSQAHLTQPPKRLTITEATYQRIQTETQELQDQGPHARNRIDVPPRAILEHCVQRNIWLRDNLELMIHTPTWDPNDAPSHLILAIASQGARDCSVVDQPHVLAEALAELCRRCLLALQQQSELETITPEYLHAHLLVMFDAVSSGNRKQLKRSQNLDRFTVLITKGIGAFVRSPPVEIRPDTDLEVAWRQWRDREYRLRVGYHSIIFAGLNNLLWDSEPNTLFVVETGQCPIPCSDELWFARSAHAWRQVFAPAVSPPSPIPAQTVLQRILDPRAGGDYSDCDPAKITTFHTALIVIMLHLFAVQLGKHMRMEVLFLGPSVAQARRVQEESLEAGYDYFEKWLRIKSAEAGSPSYISFASLYHLSAIIANRLPMNVLQALVQWRPDGQNGVVEALKGWATADDGKVARRCAWHAGQTLALHTRTNHDNSASWYQQNGIAFFYAAITLYSFVLFAQPEYPVIRMLRGQPRLQLDATRSRSDPRVDAWLRDGDADVFTSAVPDLRGRQAAEAVVEEAASVLGTFTAPGVCMTLEKILRNFAQHGPHRHAV